MRVADIEAICVPCRLFQASVTVLSDHLCSGRPCTCQVGKHDGIPARSPHLPRPTLNLPPMLPRTLS